MNQEDQNYMYTIINLEISYLEVLRALSIYFDFRADGYTPEQAYQQVTNVYMETGDIPRSNTQNDL